MINDIENEVRYTRNMIGKEALDARVMKAMGEVPRDRFVPPDMLALRPDHRVLEIGTGG